MIASVSADFAAPSRPASTTRRNYHFASLPDLNRETKHRISKAAAWGTFAGICLMLRHEKRKGRTAAIRQAADANEEIGVGLRHLARDVGLNVSTVRRHVRRLVEIGVIAVWNPNVSFHADLATGRIVTKAKGRCENTRVYLTIQPQHLRPARAGMGAICAHQPADPSPCKAQSAPTVRDSKNQRTPDGDAVGIGTPPAGPGGRLTAAEAPGLSAGEAGGHTAAKASQEGNGILPADAGRDEPVLPPGRLTRAAAKAAPPRRKNVYQEGSQGPHPFTGKHADAFERTRRRLEAEQAARDAEDARLAALAPATPPAADEAADRLREALVTIPDERRNLVRRDVQRQADADDPEAAMLDALIKRRRAETSAEAAARRKVRRRAGAAAGL